MNTEDITVYKPQLQKESYNTLNSVTRIYICKNYTNNVPGSQFYYVDISVILMNICFKQK